MKFKKIVSLLLVVAMIFALISCDSNTTTNNEVENQPEVVPDLSMQEKLEKGIERNYDTVAWLTLPNTGIDDAVLQSWDNEYYEGPVDEDKNYDPFGVFYADYRCDLLNGRKMLDSNTIVYGHSDYKDDPTTDGKRFSKLYYYKDFYFLKDNPYICFSTEGEDMIFQIFAVFYATVNKDDPNYFYYWSIPEWDYPSVAQAERDQAFIELVENARKRSEYIIDLDVVPGDKILTLSTCTGNYNGHLFTVPNSGYENYRFVVMAKLLDETSIPSSCTTQMVVNTNPLRS